ncbi:hypothetical protein [Rothia uropygioeca]|uniref:hypothetical protein n=1 Tax=Kocuria sp. 257 TaxID=2021970 RepID=UPI0013EE33A1|nr:hypothetical protein [Kocuria sp. 257]
MLLWGPVLVIDAIPELDDNTAVSVPVAFGTAGFVAPIVVGWVSIPSLVRGAYRRP